MSYVYDLSVSDGAVDVCFRFVAFELFYRFFLQRIPLEAISRLSLP